MRFELINMLGKSKDEDESKPERAGNENGEIQPRPFDTTKIAGVLTILVSLLLICTVLGGSGVVKAEQEVVEESGGMSVQLRPEFDDVSYVVDQQVMHKEPFLQSEDYYELDGDLTEDNITDGRVRVGDDDGLWINSEDIETNSTEEMYYEMRFKIDDDSGTADILRLWDENLDDGVSQRIEVNQDSVLYADSTDSTYEIDFDSILPTGETLRLGVTLGTSGGLTVEAMHDNYTEIETISADNSTVTSEDITSFRLEYSSPSPTYTDFYYAWWGEEGSAPDKTYTPSNSDTNWQPSDEYKRKQEIDLSQIEGSSGDQEINDMLGIEDAPEFEDERYVDSNRAVNLTSQTPEEQKSSFDGESFYVGWENLNDKIESEMIKTIADNEDVDRSMVNIIDYSIDDITLENEFQNDFKDNIRDEYADEILEQAEENGWKLNVDGVTDGYESVDSILANTDLQKEIIDGKAHYGANKIDNTQVKMNGMSIGESDFERTAHDVFKDPGPVKASIMDWFEDQADGITDGNDWKIDFGKELSADDIQENWEQLTGGLRERAMPAFAFGSQTIGDIQDSLSSNIVDDTFSSASELPERMIQSTNAALSSVLGSANTSMNSLMDFTEEGFNGFVMSLAQAGEAMNSLLNETGNMLLTNAARAASSPLSLLFNNPLTKIITYTIIIGIVIVIIAAVAITWKGSGAFKKRG